ncbi:MAG: biopolymer transporter ExbD [Methylococcales bacterium]
MAFKTQSEEQETMSEINVTPLVDVMLVLVVILLVTAPLLTQSVKVNLPKTATTTPDMKEQPLQLGIDEKGAITLNKNVIADLAGLEALLKDKVTQDPEISVHLYADKNVNYGRVAETIATVQHAGISKLGFVSLEQ